MRQPQFCWANQPHGRAWQMLLEGLGPRWENIISCGSSAGSTWVMLLEQPHVQHWLAFSWYVWVSNLWSSSFALMWCLLCYGKLIKLVGPNVEVDEATEKGCGSWGAKSHLLPCISLFTVLLIFCQTSRLGLFWFSPKQEGKAACKLLPIAELENISEKIET